MYGPSAWLGGELGLNANQPASPESGASGIGAATHWTSSLVRSFSLPTQLCHWVGSCHCWTLHWSPRLGAAAAGGAGQKTVPAAATSTAATNAPARWRMSRAAGGV